MLKKIAAAAVLAGALAFGAAAPAVLSAGSVADKSGNSVATGNWPNPMTEKGKKDKKTDADTSYTTYTGNWPNPMTEKGKKDKKTDSDTSYTTYTGNWPNPM